MLFNIVRDERVTEVGDIVGGIGAPSIQEEKVSAEEYEKEIRVIHDIHEHALFVRVDIRKISQLPAYLLHEWVMAGKLVIERFEVVCPCTTVVRGTVTAITHMGGKILAAFAADSVLMETR